MHSHGIVGKYVGEEVDMVVRCIDVATQTIYHALVVVEQIQGIAADCRQLAEVPDKLLDRRPFMLEAWREDPRRGCDNGVCLA
ncbi:hypothetical protein [Sphingobium yanoikuyae]|uniref:hypothetical protein n=1 Tax=Sphingobium yanoikuyae TaxID=13690 RepID=UPI001F47CE4F|nr:hypothetical protein [Sphingobium yanoikuyae]